MKPDPPALAPVSYVSKAVTDGRTVDSLQDILSDNLSFSDTLGLIPAKESAYHIENFCP